MDNNLNGVWCLYIFSPIEFISKFLSQNAEFAALTEIDPEHIVLKSFEAFSTITIKGVYISDTCYMLSSLPKEMSLKTDDVFYYDVCNGEIHEVEEAKQEDVSKVEIPDTVVKKYETEDLTESMNELNKKGNIMRQEEMKRRRENIVEQTMKKLARTEAKAINEGALRQELLNNFELKEMNNELLRKNMDNLNQEFIENKREALRNLFRKEESRRTPLLPDKMVELSYILGYSAMNCPKVQYNSNGKYSINTNVYHEETVIPEKKHFYFTSGATLVKLDPINLKQNFFIGHSEPISNFILACNGEILFSNQEGKNSTIRVWRVNGERCIKMLTTPFTKITVLSESKDNKYLCTVGLNKSKETIILWDISDCEDIKFFIEKSVPYQINAMKFCPFDPHVMISCGKENVLFWDIKAKCLKCCPVVLEQYARGVSFMCLDFNTPIMDDDSFYERSKVFVGASNGCILQITCANRELDAVYKVQESPLLAIASNDHFVATGSLDGHLRVWPVTFSEFLIEAKHDSGVCSLDISNDAIEVLCGTQNGNIGILNIEDKQYKTILRSPPTAIKKLFLHPNGEYVFTIEEDNSVRIWDVDKKSEAFQFLSTKDTPTAIAAPLHNEDLFACGFSNGVVKILNLKDTSIQFEFTAWNTRINHLLYIQKDVLLIVMDAYGNMSIHDTKNNYIAMKQIKIDQSAPFTDISLSNENDYFATIGPESNCVLVWNVNTFGIKNRIPISNFFVKKVCLINKDLIAVILENCCVKYYALCAYEGVFLKEMLNIHISSINSFITSRNYKYLISGGEEGMIKIWDMKMVFKKMQSYQYFNQHPNGIRGLFLLEKKSMLISASEHSGIVFWHYKGDITFTDSEIMKELEKLTNSKNFPQLTATTPSDGVVGSKKQFIRITPQIKKNVVTSPKGDVVEEAKNETNPSYEIIKKGNKSLKDMPYDGKGVLLSALPLLDDNDNLDISYSNTDFNITQENLDKYASNDDNDNNNNNKDNNNNNDLSDLLLFSTKALPNKLERFVPPEHTSDKLQMKYVLGLSISSLHNLVYNNYSHMKWYAYTVNNKIIIEFLLPERKQLILSDTLDELSCLTLSPNQKYLLAGVGCAFREEYASILIYDTTTFNLVKKISNFHFKGVQCIKVSPNNKYMITIGTKEEKSICIWNFKNLTVMDSKTVKFSIFDIVCELNNDYFLYFVSVSQNVISFWRMDANMKMEGFHINFEDLTKERQVNENITGITLTPYYEQLKTSFVLLGTNKGNIIILDKEKKIVIRKYMICKYPITKLFYFANTFICCGDGPLLFQWNFDEKKISMSNVFTFFEKEKANLLYLDSGIVSIHLNPVTKDGLITTEFASLFFVNFLQKLSLRILSSHSHCKVNSFEQDLSGMNLITSATDSTVRCWTTDSYDLRFQIMKLEQTPNKIVLDHKNNLLFVQYEESYIRLCNFDKLSSMGIIRIQGYDIVKFSLLFNNDGVLAYTVQGKLFVVLIESIEPLTLTYAELSKVSAQLPIEHKCNSLESKMISNENSIVVLSFANGDVVTLNVQKLSNAIDVKVIDKFNILLTHASIVDDKHIHMLNDVIHKNKNSHQTQAVFTFNNSDDLYICCHEGCNSLFVRNYRKGNIVKHIPLTYKPYSLCISNDDKYIAIGTKEGIVLFITRMEDTFDSGFNLDIFYKHYDCIDTVMISKDCKKLYSTCMNEVIIWDIKSS